MKSAAIRLSLPAVEWPATRCPALVKAARVASPMPRLAPVTIAVLPRPADHDRAGTFPHDSLAALREAGLLALTVPRRLGGGGQAYYNLTAAAALIAALPPLILALTIQRYLVRGLSFGAVKA